MSITMKTKIGHRDEPVFPDKAISISIEVKYLEIILDKEKNLTGRTSLTKEQPKHRDIGTNLKKDNRFKLELY